MKKVLFLLALGGIFIGCSGGQNQNPPENPNQSNDEPLTTVDDFVHEETFDTLDLYQKEVFVLTKTTPDCMYVKFELLLKNKSKEKEYSLLEVYAISPLESNDYLVGGIYSQSVEQSHIWRISYALLSNFSLKMENLGSLLSEEKMQGVCMQLNQDGGVYDMQIWMLGEIQNYYIHLPNLRDGINLFRNQGSYVLCGCDWWQMCLL